MLFNSLTYLTFLFVVSIFYYLLPHKFRPVLLLVASCIFYMAWSPVLIFLILFSTAVNFIISKYIYYNDSKKFKKNMLILSLIINFGILFFFKYLVFINHTFEYIFHYFNMVYPVSDFDIILPMGISFYTFQAASYVFDVYRGDIKPIKHFFNFFLFVIFFPPLVAGPIERTQNLYPQLFSKKNFELDNLIIGLKFMAFGFFKKIVIADRISVCVRTVYNNPNHHAGLPLVIATVLFGFQIYCDFSGYSDIAQGSAKIFGIDLVQNFRQPYLSKSIKEFWSRWHISLSTWFKDYLYFPLGGNRVPKMIYYRNILITFIVSGLWHGANWTFLIWGSLHGMYQIIENMLGGLFPKSNKFFSYFGFIKVIITFSLVSFAWIFFRANTISDGFYIAKHLLWNFKSWTSPQYLYNILNNLGLSIFELAISLFSIAFLCITDFFAKTQNIHVVLNKKPFILRYSFYFAVLLIIFVLGVFQSGSEFIYFQF